MELERADRPKKSVSKSVVWCFEKVAKAAIQARKKSAPLPALVSLALFCASLAWLGYVIFLSITTRF